MTSVKYNYFMALDEEGFHTHSMFHIHNSMEDVRILNAYLNVIMIIYDGKIKIFIVMLFPYA